MTVAMMMTVIACRRVSESRTGRVNVGEETSNCRSVPPTSSRAQTDCGKFQQHLDSKLYRVSPTPPPPTPIPASHPHPDDVPSLCHRRLGSPRGQLLPQDPALLRALRRVLRSQRLCHRRRAVQRSYRWDLAPPRSRAKLTGPRDSFLQKRRNAARVPRLRAIETEHRHLQLRRPADPPDIRTSPVPWLQPVLTPAQYDKGLIRGLGWSEDEKLLVVSEDGMVRCYSDLQGDFTQFSLGHVHSAPRHCCDRI